MYDIACEHSPVGSSETHERYSEIVDNPRTKWTIRRYVSKVDQYNLLKTEGKSRDDYSFL